MEAGASVTVDVLANDIDPEGGPLTLVSASAEFGTATVEGNQLVYQTAPGFDGLDTVAYIVSDAAGNRSLGTLTVTVAAAPAETGFGLSDLSDGTTEIVALSSGLLEISISGGTAFDGTYIVDPVDLETGPVNLAPPVLSHDGTPEIGETVTATAGLWIYDTGAGAPDLVRQWRSDSGGGFADIAGETGLTHVVADTESGSALRLSETATQPVGSRSADSAPVSIALFVPPPPPPPPPFAETGVVADGVTTRSVAPATLSPAREAMVFFSVVPAALNGRMRVMSMDASNIRFMLEANGSFQCLWSVGSANYSFSGGSFAAGQRISFLSAWTAASATQSRLRAWYRLDAGAWTALADQTHATAGDVALNKRRIGLVSDYAGNEKFAGTIYRGAFWSGAAGALPDISDPAIRDLFTTAGGTLADPAATRDFGTLQIDFAGSKADWNAGRHAGALGPFTVTGTFS